MTEVEEPTLAPGNPVPRPRRSPVILLTAGALALLVVALAVGLAITGVRLHDADGNSSRLRQADAVDSARVSSLAAAQVYAVELGSYNYKTLNTGFATVKSHSTPAFIKTFDRSEEAAELLLSRFKAVSTAHVIAAGLTSCTATQAVALVLLKQLVTSTAQKKNAGPSDDDSRLSMTLVKVHGNWMIQEVQLLAP